MNPLSRSSLLLRLRELLVGRLRVDRLRVDRLRVGYFLGFPRLGRERLGLDLGGFGALATALHVRGLAASEQNLELDAAVLLHGLGGLAGVREAVEAVALGEKTLFLDAAGHELLGDRLDALLGQVLVEAGVAFLRSVAANLHELNVSVLLEHLGDGIEHGLRLVFDPGRALLELDLLVDADLLAHQHHQRLLVRAAVVVLELVDRLGFRRALVLRHRDLVVVLVEVRAAVLVVRSLSVFLLGGALVIRIRDAIAVVVRRRRRRGWGRGSRLERTGHLCRACAAHNAERQQHQSRRRNRRVSQSSHLPVALHQRVIQHSAAHDSRHCRATAKSGATFPQETTLAKGQKRTRRSRRSSLQFRLAAPTHSRRRFNLPVLSGCCAGRPLGNPAQSQRHVELRGVAGADREAECLEPTQHAARHLAVREATLGLSGTLHGTLGVDP